MKSLNQSVFYILSSILLLITSLDLNAQCNTNLGVDQTICAGNTITLKPTGVYASYLWSTGANSDSLNVASAGTYWLRTTDGMGCISTDTVVIDTFATVPVYIGPKPPDSTFFCTGDTVTLDAGPGYVSYLWSDLSTGQTVTSTFAGTFIVEVTDNNGCVLTDTTVLAAKATPVVGVTSDSVCPGDTGIMVATTGYDGYLWSNGDTTFNTQASVAGVYTVTVTNEFNCTTVGSAAINNFFVAKPQLGVDDTLCVGQSKSLNPGSGYVSFLWNTGETQQVKVADTTGTYWVEIVDTNGCIASDTVSLTFQNGPIYSLGNDTSICTEDSITLSTPAGQLAYLWNTGDTTPSIVVNAADTYSVEVTGLNGCSNLDTIIITNLPVPVVNLGSDISYCENTTFTQPIDAGAGFTSYNWMDGSTQQIRISSNSDSLVWVEVTDANTCTARDSLFVIALNLPQVDLGVDDTICSGNSKILNAGTANGSITDYNWNTGDTIQSISFTGPLNITSTANNTFRVTVTDTNSCVNADTVVITTVPLPSPDLGSDTSYCFGDVFSKTLNPGNFDSYQWSTGANTQTIVIGAFDSAYSVTVTDSTGCVNSDNFTVTENTLPNPDLGNDTSYCEGVTFAVALNPGGFQGFEWSDGTTGPILLITTAGNYDVTVTDVNGCKNSDDILVTELPKPSVDLGMDQTYCENEVFTATLDAGAFLPPLGYTYSWNTGESTPAILINSFGTYSVTVVDDNNNCTDSSSVEYVPFNLVQPDLGPDAKLCDGEFINLEPNVNVESGYTFTWSTGASTRSINVNEEGTYWVELNAVNGTCTGIRDSITLTLGLQPIVELGPDIQACVGQTVILLNNETSIPDASYIWQDSINTASFPVTKTGTYRVNVTNECGTVSDEIDVLFEDCYQVYIPSAFTPNGDGLNDYYFAQTDQELLEFNLLIYDRWGRIVFKTNDIRAKWDGTINGEFAADGMYVWKMVYIAAFDPSGSRVERTGHLNLSK